MRLGEQPAGVVVAAVARRDLVVIADVVAGVVERRIEPRIDPDGVHAEALDVIQLLDDARQVADAVAVGIIERLRINLIHHGVVHPFRAGRDDVLAGDGGFFGAGGADEQRGEEQGINFHRLRQIVRSGPSNSNHYLAVSGILKGFQRSSPALSRMLSGLRRVTVQQKSSTRKGLHQSHTYRSSNSIS